jgi:PadR family transcriptional regulator, regulatory protein PadR
MKQPKHYIGEFEELVLLAILSLRNDAYGVKIGDAIEEATGRSVSIGALYTTLSRLEDKGLISSWKGEATAERGGRAKKFFKIEAPAKLALSNAETSRQRLRPEWSPQES